MLKFIEFNIQLFAHKKGQSSTSNGRDSAGRRLGAKAADGELIMISNLSLDCFISIALISNLATASTEHSTMELTDAQTISLP